MGLIDLDVRLGDLIDVGSSVVSAINKNSKNKQNNEQNSQQENLISNNNSENIVVRCPGCGYKNAIIDGDGLEDRCEYCGTIIGN